MYTTIFSNISSAVQTVWFVVFFAVQVDVRFIDVVGEEAEQTVVQFIVTFTLTGSTHSLKLPSGTCFPVGSAMCNDRSLRRY